MTQVAVAPSQQLQGILISNGLEEDRAVLIAEKFNGFFLMGNEWAEKAKNIKVTSSEQVIEMQQAREGRLFLQKRRTGIEKLRKDLKDRSLKEGRAIDLIAKHLTSLIEPTERYLEEQERFPIREKARLRQELLDSRRERLRAFNADHVNDNWLATQTEQEFIDYLDTCRQLYEDDQLKQQQAAAQAQRDAEEAKRLREENQRLQRMVEHRGEQIAVQASTIQTYVDEDKARRQAEGQRRQAELEEEQQNNLASDREKLTKLASSLSRAAIPHVESREAADIIDRVEQMLTDIENFIQREAAKL